jgi:hypothetical protein
MHSIVVDLQFIRVQTLRMYCRKQNKHFADCPRVARLISVDKYSVLLT